MKYDFEEAKIIKPFADATMSVFTDFLKTELEQKVPYPLAKNFENFLEMSGQLPFGGDVKGSAVLSMSVATVTYLSKKFWGKDSATEEENIDTIQETINIISGNAKIGIEESYKDPQLAMGLPSTVTGVGHKISWNTKSNSIICVPFVVKETGEDVILLIALEMASE